MGGACTAIIGDKIPNLYLIALHAVEHELTRRQTWFLNKITEMETQRKASIEKAKEYIKKRELLLALTSAKAAIMENEKIKALNPIKEELAKGINELGVEIKQESSKQMTIEILKEQMAKKPLVIIKELVVKWVAKFEDMINNPVSSADFIGELEKDIHSNPVELFKKLKAMSTELGDFDESAIFLEFNPQLQALKVSRKMIEEKQKWASEEMRTYQVEKDSCVAQAKKAAADKNYMNALVMVKALPLYEAKLKAGALMENGLKEELSEIDAEIKKIETAKPSLDELEAITKQDPSVVMQEVITKWMKKQQDVVGKVASQGTEMAKQFAAPISMNPLEIVKELNKSGVVGEVELPSATAVLGDKAGAVVNNVAKNPAVANAVNNVAKNPAVANAVNDIAGQAKKTFGLW